MLGLTPDEAQTRLKESGKACTLKYVEPRRPVGPPCEARVMRAREKTLSDSSAAVELLIGNFRKLDFE